MKARQELDLNRNKQGINSKNAESKVCVSYMDQCSERWWQEGKIKQARKYMWGGEED